MSDATNAPFIVVFIPHQRPQFVRTFESEQNLVDRWVNGEFARSCSAGPSEDYREESSWTFDNAIADLGHDLSNLLVIRDADEYEAEMKLDRVRGVRKELIEAAVELGWVSPKYVIALHISTTMTSDQRRRWNSGNLLDDDLDSIKIHYRDSTYTVRDLMPVEDGGRNLNHDLWKLIEDERADEV